jgi:hypothetical protein
MAAGLGRHTAGFYVRRAHRLLGQPPPPLPRPWSARFADWRLRLHAGGRMVGLQQATRVVAHELQALRQAMGTPAARRLLDPGWYGRHLRRLRGAPGGWHGKPLGLD